MSVKDCCRELGQCQMHQFPHLENGGDNQWSVLGEFRKLHESMEVKPAAPCSQRNDSLSVNYWMYHLKWSDLVNSPRSSSLSPSLTRDCHSHLRVLWPLLHLAQSEIILLIYLITYHYLLLPPLGHECHEGRDFCPSWSVSPKHLTPRRH